MSRLVYHELSGAPGQSSPFDKAVLEVAKTGEVNIVSPYIGVDYLQRIIRLSAGWRLISDVEAWLSSLSMRARPKAWMFIRENIDSIHHCPDVHAKAIISKELAMFGSANLTNTGILGRTELGVLIDDPGTVAELGRWFDTLWQQTHPPIADETSAFVQWLDEEAERTSVRREKFSLSASTKKVRARLVALPPSGPKEAGGQSLNLGAIAQTLIIEEQKHYDSLQEAIESAVNALAEGEFTFGQIVDYVRQSFMTSTLREIYFALLQYCANHVRSVFAEGTRNRLILSSGRFTQSTKESLHSALVPFDELLSLLVRHFDFNQVRDMPDEDVIEGLTGICGVDQIILISELLDCGFLEIEDIAGHLPRYILSEVFEWDGRYKLFEKAKHVWEGKKSQSFKEETMLGALIADKDEYVGHGISLGSISEDMGDFGFGDDAVIRVGNLESYLQNAKVEQARIQQERISKIDKVLANVLSRLFKGETISLSESLLLKVSEETNVGKRLVDHLLSGRGRNIPNVITCRNKNISINPKLDWKDLADFPLTQNVCKTFLGM